MKAYHLHHRSTRKAGLIELLPESRADAATFEVSGVDWPDRYDRLNAVRRRRDLLARLVAGLAISAAYLIWEMATR